MTDQPGWIKLAQGPHPAVLQAGGAWTVEYVADLDRQVELPPPKESGPPRPGPGRDRGHRHGRRLAAGPRQRPGREPGGSLAELLPQFQPLAERVLTAGPKVIPDRPKPRTALPRLGRGNGAGVEYVGDRTLDLIAFFGEFVLATGRIIANPRSFRWVPLLVHIEQTGINALPIVGLISFLVGVVLAYQGADQLRQFNEIYLTVTWSASPSVEMGYRHAIVVAGRSGSGPSPRRSGTMQGERGGGRAPHHGPRPHGGAGDPARRRLRSSPSLILTFFADLMVILLGGGVMCVLLIDMTFGQYVGRLERRSDLRTRILVGTWRRRRSSRFSIALVGCFEGLRVTGSAESVGTDDHARGGGGHLPRHHLRRSILHPVFDPEHLRCPSEVRT